MNKQILNYSSDEEENSSKNTKSRSRSPQQKQLNIKNKKSIKLKLFDKPLKIENNNWRPTKIELTHNLQNSSYLQNQKDLSKGNVGFSEMKLPKPSTQLKEQKLKQFQCQKNANITKNVIIQELKHAAENQLIKDQQQDISEQELQALQKLYEQQGQQNQNDQSQNQIKENEIVIVDVNQLVDKNWQQKYQKIEAQKSVYQNAKLFAPSNKYKQRNQLSSLAFQTLSNIDHLDDLYEQQNIKNYK